MTSTDLWGTEIAFPSAFGSHEHNPNKNDEWLTPPELIDSLGIFDLDPCSPRRRPWDTARRHYDLTMNGLRQEWAGRVWLNPPYGHAGKWLGRLAAHGRGTALVFARTETKLWFTHVWPHASGILFIRGRIHFHYVDGRRAGPAGAPSALIAYGDDDADQLAETDYPGAFVRLD